MAPPDAVSTWARRSSCGASRGLIGPSVADRVVPLRRRLPATTRRSSTKELQRPSQPDGSPFELDSGKAAVLLFFLAFLYGGNVPLLKAIETEGPIQLTAPEVLTLRFVTACLFAVPWVVFNFNKVTPVLLPGIELAFWLWLGYTLQILGLEKTSVTTAAITSALIGVTVQTLEVTLEGQPLRPVVVASSVGIIFGLWVFASAPGGVEHPVNSLVDRVLNFFSVLAPTPAPMPHEAWLGAISGEVLSILGAIGFGIHVWRCNRIVAANVRAPSEETGDDFELALAIVQCVVTTFFCVVFSTLDNPYPARESLDTIQRLDKGLWLQIAACGVICTGLPAVLELFAFKVVEPAVASLIYCTIPLWGTVLGVIFLKDAFGPQSAIGGAIILASSLVPSLVDLLSPGAPTLTVPELDPRDFTWTVAKSVGIFEEGDLIDFNASDTAPVCLEDKALWRAPDGTILFLQKAEPPEGEGGGDAPTKSGTAG